MKKFFPHIIVSLFICLFIYLFYRTEKTLVNQLFIYLFSLKSYSNIKEEIITLLPLHHYLVYSLPEGLWVFCITITSQFFYCKIGRYQLNLALVPLLFAVGLEMLQYYGLTNGRFDPLDIMFALFFWLLALLITRQQQARENIFTARGTARLYCFFCYGIVYLAHVSP